MRRMRHRAAIDIMKRGYSGANKGRLTDSWSTPSTSANAEIAMSGRLLRDRMRDLVRNNPYAANAMTGLINHAVGAGIRPRAKDARVNKLFADWCAQCDADGYLDFFGIQALAVRGMLESGDGIVRRRRRLPEDGLVVPLQLQVLETDHIDASVEGDQPNGNTAIQGIELGSLGKPRAYWMFPTHPGNSFYESSSSFQSKPILAQDIAHVFVRDRTQVRGVPWGASVISDLHDLQSYEEAELTRKRLEACFVGVLTGGDETDGVGLPINGESNEDTPGIYDAHGARVEKFAPGMFYNAVGGRDVKFSQPATTGGYDAYKTSMLHTIAAGFKVPHALLSGRLDKVNYSSTKVGFESFKRTIEALQWQFIIPMLCQPLWDWFCEAAYLSGAINTRNVPVEWSPPRFPSADPQRDVAALVAEVRGGLKPLTTAISESGYDPDEVLAAYAASNEKVDTLGLIFDSDPRHMSGAGQLQSVSDAVPDDPPEDTT